jgi:aminopeptidase
MPTDLRTRKLAKLALNYSVNAKPGEKVIISGSQEAIPFMVELYKETILAGAIPIVRFGLPNVSDFYYKHANKEQLEHFPQYWFDTVKQAQCYIGIDTDDNTRELTSTDAKKIAIRQKVNQKISNYIVNTRDKIRRVTIAYPCISHAQEASMSFTDWENFIYKACLADWKKIKIKLEKIKSFFKENSSVHLIGENVDLKMKVHGKLCKIDAGEENMPGGEIFMAPIRESLEGWIKFDYPRIVSGKLVSGVKLKFEKGKVVEFSAEEGKEFLSELLKTDDNACYVGELGIGCNPNIKKYSNNLLFDEKIMGTIHLALGMAYKDNGGGNDSAIHVDIVKDMKKGRIIVDNKIIQEHGKWKI